MKKNVKMLPGEFLPDFFKRERFKNIPIHENTLFIEEDMLHELPRTWAECVMLLVAKNYQGAMQSNDNCVMLDFDDQQMQKALEFVANKSIRLYVCADKIWEVNAYSRDDTGEIYFVGGENLRKFLDKKDIHYSSFLTDSGLISSTDMQYHKDKNEDCRKPLDINVD